MPREASIFFGVFRFRGLWFAGDAALGGDVVDGVGGEGHFGEDFGEVHVFGLFCGSVYTGK